MSREAMQMALEALESDPVSHLGLVHRKLAITALRQALETEPFEYWNAVEGWVKIDEVREHFDAVGCGTIYKSAGEGRSPLYTAPQKKEWVGLTDEEIEEIVGPWGDTPIKGYTRKLFDQIEAKLKEKNNG